MPGAVISSDRPYRHRSADARCYRRMPGHPSKHGANVGAHRSRPLRRGCLGARPQEAACIIGKGPVPGATRHVVCDGGLATAADTLGNSCWRRAGPMPDRAFGLPGVRIKRRSCGAPQGALNAPDKGVRDCGARRGQGIRLAVAVRARQRCLLRDLPPGASRPRWGPSCWTRPALPVRLGVLAWRSRTSRRRAGSRGRG